MERRLLLAIGLMVGLMVLSNVIFPPARGPVAEGADSTLVVTSPTVDEGDQAEGDETAGAVPAEEAVGQEAAALGDRLGEAAAAEAPTVAQETATGAAQTISVRSELYEYVFDTRGARLVHATMNEYPNFAPDRDVDGPVDLIRPGDALLGYTLAMGGDTVSLRDIVFGSSGDDMEVTREGMELAFSAPLGAEGVSFDVTYSFSPTDYRIDIRAGLRNVAGQGYTVLTDLGRGLRSNEATPREDLGQMAVVTRTRTGSISSEKLDLDAGEWLVVEGGPFNWAASKSKYFLAAIVSDEQGPGLGGVLLAGLDEGDASEIRVALPVPGGADGFEMLAYVGPQDHDRLRAVGQELQNVNPFGWRILQWFIRPFGGLVIDVLVWMHETFNLAYGWVLILFGVVTRIVLFPLYQISMRSQMKQMALQPEIKGIQEKYKEDPPKLQQEMMKAYKEAGVSPLGGCLPMMLPLPILITLFFVFQNTIEFRGVPFLWLPDLSLKDPLYIVPFLMGGSMLLLNWIGQRGMETNPQMKMFTYVLPVVFTFMFAQFAAGLNLYYSASNIASLPQQLYLSKERRAHQAKAKTKTKTKDAGGGGSGGASGKKPAGGKRGQTKTGGTRPRGKRS
ncbi:MAG: membrane protein insertase YidC [Gemmatimonadota bacterium]|nr:membrane protein insertase YidC [Gemmatimonadota bacterium]